MRNIVLVDIDHTIANSYWRDPMIGGEGGWDAYHKASTEDKPHPDMVRLLQSLREETHSWYLIGITARPERWRQMTMSTLYKWRISLDEILMRADDAFHPAPEIKINLARARFAPRPLKDVVAFMIDDRDDVAAAFKAEGVYVLQAHSRRDD